jgi:hypothetical protein
MQRLDRLSGLMAEDIADSGRKASLASGLVRGLSAFAGSYLARGGWREGRLGVVCAMFAGALPVVASLRATDVLEARRVLGEGLVSPASLQEIRGAAAR